MPIERDPAVVSLLAGHFQATPAYWVARPDGSTSWLLILTVSGRGWVGGEPFAPGDAALLSPRHPQAYRASEDGWEIRWAHFHPRPTWAPLLAWPEARPGLRRASLKTDFGSVVESLESARVHGGRAADPYEERLAMVALESALIRIRRAADDDAPSGDRRVERAIAYALRHLGEPFGPAEMAHAAGVSASRLGALFRAEVGVSPRTFVERQRIDRARQLLAMTDLPVKAIATEVGFASEFYFANRFRQAVGMSPSACRAAARLASIDGDVP